MMAHIQLSPHSVSKGAIFISRDLDIMVYCYETCI